MVLGLGMIEKRFATFFMLNLNVSINSAKPLLTVGAFAVTYMAMPTSTVAYAASKMALMRNSDPPQAFLMPKETNSN